MRTRIYFYGRLAGARKRDAQTLARSAGFRVSHTLDETVNLIVLGEESPLAQTRAELSQLYDERTRASFEAGSLRVVTESEFLRMLEAPRENAAASVNGYTPGSIAELVGVSVVTIRRWMRRGFLRATLKDSALPLLAPREILVARRLAFLLSGNVTEEALARYLTRLTRFDLPKVTTSQELNANAPVDVGDVILQTSLSDDGSEPLYCHGVPFDSRGQMRFPFDAQPTDGSYVKPEPPEKLSKDEEEIALADSLAQWNAEKTQSSARPAFLDLFTLTSDAHDADVDAKSVSTPATMREMKSDSIFADPERFQALIVPQEEHESSENAALDPTEAIREHWQNALSRQVYALYESAWRLEQRGDYLEALRVYRIAALMNGPDAGLYYRLGMVLMRLDDFTAARERFYAALEIDENYVDARIELARTLAALGEYDDALSAYQGALEERPDDAELAREYSALAHIRGEKNI